MLVFRFSMPSVGSWNDVWAGRDREYTFFAPERDAKHKLKDRYDYDFGDGWTARIDVTKVDSREVPKLRRRSDGFCGYEWMVRSILRHGEIRSTSGVEEEKK